MNTRGVLAGYYDYRLVVLSVVIAVLASYAALDLAGRVTTARGKIRLGWLCCGSAAMGIGIWAMHYVGMEAYHLPVPVLYDWPTVLLSLFAAVAASGAALLVVSRPTMGITRAFAGSLLMGGGIAAMHYIGMRAMRLPAMPVYSPKLVVLSVGLAIAISYVALQLTFAHKQRSVPSGWRKFGCAVIMGLAIPVMHYSGMAAMCFMPDPAANIHLGHSISVNSLGLASIITASVLILGLVFLTSVIDRRLSLQDQRLTNNQLQFEAVFESMTDGIVVLDLQHNVVLMNQASKRLFGIRAQPPSLQQLLDVAVPYSPVGEVLGEDQRPSVLALQGKFVRGYEMGILKPDTGKIVLVEVNTAPVTNQSGETVQIILSYRDITERKQLDESQRRLAAIVESSEDAIIGKNEMGIVTSWNKGAEKVFRYTSQEMIGQPILRLLPPGRETEERDILARIRRGETVEHFETERVRKDGKTIFVSLMISPIRDIGGRVIGASKIARDITEKRLLERQLRQSQKMEAVGQLTGGLAHDFNNLLGVIIGNLDLLSVLLAGNDAAMKRVLTAQKAALRGGDITKRLLGLSSNQELKPLATTLDESIQNTIELAARALGPEITIATHFDATVPQVFVDPAGLESALLNLAVNARDAMPKGGSLTLTTQLSHLDGSFPSVQTGEIRPGDYACISVSDTGHGMSRETLERVFEPFFTTKPRGKGTGLGLAMVYGFAKQTGGTVRIYSEKDYGTTVSLYLPLAEGRVRSEAMPAQGYLYSRTGGSVLVVDDEEDLLEIAVSYLKDMGYTAMQAKDATSALRILGQHKDIDLMVTDIIMPGGMNGVELAKTVRRLCPDIKVVYSSGFPADALTERSGSRVDAPLLRKPYQREEFVTVIHEAMEGSNSGMKSR